MNKIYVISYDACHTGEHCIACNFFTKETRANVVAKQYEACGHTNVKVLQLLSE